MDTHVGGKWRLGVCQTVPAAHALRHYEGKCEKLHGHNFIVQAEFEGSVLQEGTEILVDFKILKNLLAQALESYDHALLNEISPFDKINPSSENLARYIAKSLSVLLADALPRNSDARVRKVTVSEKEGQYAAWICGGEGA